MKHDPIAYTYDADTHCVRCTVERFGATDVHGEFSGTDSEGNQVHPVAPWAEWWNDTADCERLACGTCGEHIADAHRVDCFEVGGSGVCGLLPTALEDDPDDPFWAVEDTPHRCTFYCCPVCHTNLLAHDKPCATPVAR